MNIYLYHYPLFENVKNFRTQTRNRNNFASKSKRTPTQKDEISIHPSPFRRRPTPSNKPPWTIKHIESYTHTRPGNYRLGVTGGNYLRSFADFQLMRTSGASKGKGKASGKGWGYGGAPSTICTGLGVCRRTGTRTPVPRWVRHGNTLIFQGDQGDSRWVVRVGSGGKCWSRKRIAKLARLTDR